MHTNFKGILLNAILLLRGMVLPPSAIADAGNGNIGIVIMHGKGGSPTGLVSGLALGLEANRGGQSKSRGSGLTNHIQFF